MSEKLFTSHVVKYNLRQSTVLSWNNFFQRWKVPR